MGNIVLLDDLTINKIAAGEVIERPASVVKEMVENSIDAGANNITVEIKNGGITYIRISDNGKGIAKDDVEMAFERHATSKIRSAEDLLKVKSMGFRGEALASIAAISNVELITRQNNSPTGSKVVVEGGKILSNSEVGCSRGTIITVRNLFYNTPVRYKFLKKDFTETGYIEDVVTRIALVHPEIAIKLINSGKTVIQTNGNGDINSVIYSIYGKDIASGTIKVSYEYEYIKINGVIGKPEIARSNRSNQIFFVNNRHVKDKTLSASTEQAFKGMLPIGKFAFLVLNLEMPCSKVDANVHPAKLEVRFEEENVVFKALYNAIKDALLKSNLISNTEKIKEEQVFKYSNITVESKQDNKISTIEPAIEIGKKNIIEDIYNAQKEQTKKTNNDNTAVTMDVFEKLRLMQEQLKKDVESNPNLTLTEKYKNMQNEYQGKTNLIQNNENEEKIIEVRYSQGEEFQNSTNDATNEKDIEAMENETTDSDTSFEENIKIQNNQEIFAQYEKCESENENNKEQFKGSISNIESTVYDIESKKEQEIREDNNQYVNNINFAEMYAKTFGTNLNKNEEEQEKMEKIDLNTDITESNISVFESIPEYRRKTYKFIGIAFNTYIILQIEDEMYIMDQHAAHERIMYEKVKKNFYSNKEKDSQLLLLPDIITLTHKEMNIAKENMQMFRQAGFMVEEFGENTIKLSGVPEICVNLDTKELFLETLDEINTVARTAKQEKEEKFIATVACKSAVKANMGLSKEEVDSLMNKLLELPNPFTCPHGRPTIIKMSKTDIEKKFSRR